jgi:hypothetical protein
MRIALRLCFQFQLAPLHNGAIVAMGSPFTLGVLVCQMRSTAAAAATTAATASASATAAE